MIVSLFDYGTGNLHSLGKALAAGGADVRISDDPGEVLRGDALVLPGVGAFAAAAERLAPARTRLRSALGDGFPCLGICLGMQLLFETSDEGDGDGLGLLAGHVRRLRAERVPQMGWNEVVISPDPLFEGVDRPVVYYANSYVAAPDDTGRVVGWTRYEDDRFAAAVRTARTWGVQFHPEKSADDGLRIVANFLAAIDRDGAP